MFCGFSLSLSRNLVTYKVASVLSQILEVTYEEISNHIYTLVFSHRLPIIRALKGETLRMILCENSSLRDLLTQVFFPRKTASSGPNSGPPTHIKKPGAFGEVTSLANSKK